MNLLSMKAANATPSKKKNVTAKTLVHPVPVNRTLRGVGIFNSTGSSLEASERES
jgi:hypothetical protein